MIGSKLFQFGVPQLDMHQFMKKEEVNILPQGRYRCRRALRILQYSQILRAHEDESKTTVTGQRPVPTRVRLPDVLQHGTSIFVMNLRLVRCKSGLRKEHLRSGYAYHFTVFTDYLFNDFPRWILVDCSSLPLSLRLKPTFIEANLNRFGLWCVSGTRLLVGRVV